MPSVGANATSRRNATHANPKPHALPKHTEHRTFVQQLQRDAAAARPERRAHGESFILATFGPGTSRRLATFAQATSKTTLYAGSSAPRSIVLTSPMTSCLVVEPRRRPDFSKSFKGNAGRRRKTLERHGNQARDVGDGLLQRGARLQTRDAGVVEAYKPLRLAAVQLERQDQGEIPRVEKTEIPYRGMTPTIWRATPSTMMVLPTAVALALYFRCQ